MLAVMFYLSSSMLFWVMIPIFLSLKNQLGNETLGYILVAYLIIYPALLMSAIILLRHMPLKYHGLSVLTLGSFSVLVYLAEIFHAYPLAGYIWMVLISLPATVMTLVPDARPACRCVEKTDNME
jgi:hypothetical protein